MYLVPENLRPKIGDRPCGRIIRSAAVCLGHLGEERSRAVNRSPPGGVLDQTAWEAAGQIWQTQRCSEGELGMSTRSLTPTSGRISHKCRGRLGAWNPSGPCSKPPLWRQLLGVVVRRSSMPVVAAT